MIIKVMLVFLLFETKTVYDINWLTNITFRFYRSIALFQYQAMHSVMNFIFFVKNIKKSIARLQIIEMGRSNYIECYCHSDIF